MESSETSSRTYGSYNTTADSQLSPDINLFRSTNNEGRQAILWISPKKDSASAPFLLESNFIETLKALPEHLFCPIVDRDPSQPPMWVAHQAPNGLSIDEFISAVSQLDIPTAQSLFIKLLDLVRELHASSFFHGNLRPETIFIGENGIEIAPSYELVERNLANNSHVAPQKWISSERIQHKLPSAEEDLEAIVLLFIYVLGGIRNPNVVNRSQLLSQASKYLSMLPVNPSCRNLLMATLDENISGKPSISTVMWAIENLTNTATVEVPVVAKAVENSEIKQLEPPSPTQIVDPRPEGKKRPTKRILIYSAVSIVYLVTAILLIVAKSNNSSLNSKTSELIKTIEELQQTKSTNFNFDGSWSILPFNEVCDGWADNEEQCSGLPSNLEISSGSITFETNLISTFSNGGSTDVGYIANVRKDNFGYCGDLAIYANVSFQLIADEITPSTYDILANHANGNLSIEVPEQHGCNAASVSFSFTATR